MNVKTMNSLLKKIETNVKTYIKAKQLNERCGKFELVELRLNELCSSAEDKQDLVILKKDIQEATGIKVKDPKAYMDTSINFHWIEWDKFIVILNWNWTKGLEGSQIHKICVKEEDAVNSVVPIIYKEYGIGGKNV